MKKLTIALALILCLVLCLFAFASCGKKKGGTATDAATEPATTTTAHSHMPASTYTVDKEPTCGDAGSESKHCTVCGEIIASTVRTIQPTGNHTAGAWANTTAPTLIAEGQDTTTCTVCGTEMTRPVDKTEPIVYVSNWDLETRKANAYTISNPDDSTVKTFGVKKSVKSIAGTNAFYPTEDNEEGNDLLIEFSFLYNDTMANVDDGVLAAMYVENNNVFNVDLKTGKITATMRTGDVRLFEADGTVNHEVAIGEYGWHRFGMRIHEDVANVAGEVKYTVTATAYLDGAKILAVDKTAWATKNFSGDYTGLLYTAEIVEGQLTYKNAVDDGKHCDAYVMVEYLPKESDTPGYLVVGDINFSCGQDFVQDIFPMNTPTEATMTLAEGVTVPAAFYYAGTHEHVWDGEIFVEKEATLFEDGVGYKTCSLCGARAEDADVLVAGRVVKMTSSTTGNHDDKKALVDIQNGEHFYPTEGNASGNDLFIEFSVLWNDTLLNLAPGTNAATSPFITARIDSWNHNVAANVLTYWSPTNNIDDAWCKFAGGFEAGALQEVEPAGAAYTPAGMCAGGGNFAAYPNIGGADKDNPEYGWHRVGIQFHQELANEAALIADDEANKTAAQYKFVITLYFDGAPVSMLKGDTSRIKSHNLLFTAESDGTGNVIYKDNTKLVADNNNKITIYAFRMNAMKTKADTTAYWGDADVYYSCGKDFVQKVSKVASPAAKTITVDDKGTPETEDDVVLSAAMWYTVPCAEHTWDGNFTVTKTATVLNDGEKVEHCSVCGMSRSAVVPFEAQVYNSKSPSGYAYADGDYFFISKSVADIKGDKTFHPTATDADGNDLWFEYSFLWNDTLSNWDQSRSEMSLFGFRNAENKYRDFYYLYTKDGQSGDCPYKGHVDYSTYMGGYADADAYQCAYDLTSEGNTFFGDPVGQYYAGWAYCHPGGVTRASSPYVYDAESMATGGWHRIGVRFHQAAEVDNDKCALFRLTPKPATKQLFLKINAIAFASLL